MMKSRWIFYAVGICTIIKDISSDVTADDTGTANKRTFNGTDNKEDYDGIPARERYRRLIPYATFYSAPNYRNVYNSNNNNNNNNNLKSQFSIDIAKPIILQKYETAPLIKLPDKTVVGYFYQRPNNGYVPNSDYYKNIYQSPRQLFQAPSNDDSWKPTFIPSPPVVVENEYNRQPLTESEPDYLKFRYSQGIPQLIAAPATNIDGSSTPFTMTQSSPSSTPAPQNYATTTTRSYPTAADRHLYRQQPSIFPHYVINVKGSGNGNIISKLSKNPVPIERTTKKTLTTMTIVKSQEIEIGKQQNRFIPGQQRFPGAEITTADQEQPSYQTANDLLNGYELNKRLPDRITTDNIKDSIRTLTYLLDLLQKADSISQSHHKHHYPILYSGDGITETYKLPSLQQDVDNQIAAPVDASYSDDHRQTVDEEQTVDEQSDGTPGKAGLDYPVYSVIPSTKFSCKSQRYKGFFADPDTNCQVWHYCDLNGGQASFLCPNGTIFSQAALTCDWWFNVKCSTTPQLYVLNERLYKYIIPTRPSFPEDFSGPLVDRYLTEKFKEIESKREYRFPSNNSTAINEHQQQQQKDDEDSIVMDENVTTSSNGITTKTINEDPM